LVILAPISSWIALITSQLENAGISPLATGKTRIIADPFFIYLQSIPFIFYSIILLASVWFIVRRTISFGPMHHQEVIAQKTGNLFGGKKPIHAESIELKSSASSMWDLVIPLLVLIAGFIIGIALVGGYSLLGGSYSFLEALQKNNRTGFVLFIASIITLIVSLFISSLRKTLSYAALKLVTLNGFSMMYSSIVMVFLASTLGIMLREDLQTGTYLAQVLYGTISIALLPLLFFIISIITALITGSAWGTIALMVPIAVQMITSLMAVPLPANPIEITILFPVLGAIFSGAACGNHISPIAETTIMSSNSAGCYILDHANTQFWYTLPVIISAAVSFLCCGFLIDYPLLTNAAISLAIGIGICLAGLIAANRWFK
jgi:Na+/H+ antiporter NhaC